jgi:hypothetical protein
MYAIADSLFLFVAVVLEVLIHTDFAHWILRLFLIAGGPVGVSQSLLWLELNMVGAGLLLFQQERLLMYVCTVLFVCYIKPKDRITRISTHTPAKNIPNGTRSPSTSHTDGDPVTQQGVNA